MVSAAPQSAQNFFPGGFWAPHAAQRTGRGVPQSPQNFFRPLNPETEMLRPVPAERNTAYEIGQLINKRGYDASDIIDPAPPVASPPKATTERPVRLTGAVQTR
jgi:hypothetical protein